MTTTVFTVVNVYNEDGRTFADGGTFYVEEANHDGGSKATRQLVETAFPWTKDRAMSMMKSTEAAYLQAVKWANHCGDAVPILVSVREVVDL